MAHEITQTYPGFFIIDDHAIELVPGQGVSYRDDVAVQTFNTAEEMLAAHEVQFPEQYIVDEDI
tara:strand:- start:748 stop:939 length:192 start_codon:yes stop_codon:yes gene_type:complete